MFASDSILESFQFLLLKNLIILVLLGQLPFDLLLQLVVFRVLFTIKWPLGLTFGAARHVAP